MNRQTLSEGLRQSTAALRVALDHLETHLNNNEPQFLGARHRAGPLRSPTPRQGTSLAREEPPGNEAARTGK